MKTSFYFTLWICAWILIDLLNLPGSIIIAFVLVWIISTVLNAAFAESIKCINNNDSVKECEQIYRNDKDGYLKNIQSQLILELLWLAYLLISIVGFVCMKLEEFSTYVVFIIAMGICGRRIYVLANSRSYAKSEETLEKSLKLMSFITDSDESDNLDGYEQYRLRRSQGESASSMLMKIPSMMLKTIMLTTSGLATLLGVLTILVSLEDLFTVSEDTPSAFSAFMYGSFALFYGIKDLLDENRSIALNERTLGSGEKILQQEKPSTVWKKFTRLFSFKGRTGRVAYAATTLLFLIFMWATNLIIDLMDNYSEAHPDVEDNPLFALLGFVFASFLLIVYIIFLWVILAQGSKRCHDINHSGWCQLIPGWGLVLLLVRGCASTNKYDTPQSLMSVNEGRKIRINPLI